MNVCCHVEIEFDRVRAWREDRSIEVPVRRSMDGTLTPECKAALTSELKHLLPPSFLGSRNNVLCAISSRGLSLRRLCIPKGAPEQKRQLLALQIESEFPLPPQELAWGAMAFNGQASSVPNGVKENETEQVVVAAIRKEGLREFTEVLRACGASPVFTPAVMARAMLCPASTGKTALLEIGRTHTELLVLENSVPASLRILSWGLNERMAAENSEGEQLREPLEELAGLLRSRSAYQKVWIGGVAKHQVAPTLSQVLESPCEPLATADPRISTALAGMRLAAKMHAPLIELETGAAPHVPEKEEASPALKKWAAAALILAFCALLLPNIEAWVMQPRLEKTLAAVKADRGRLKQIDDELAFLRHLKQSQPSYIDALYLISRSAPPGTRFDALSLNKQGAMSLKASMRDGNQVADFRAKLLDTGLFSNLALEEQTPTPDRQKLTIRMSGQWKPGAAAELATAAAAKEPDPPRRPSPGGGMMPGGMPMPMPMPPGVVPPSPSGPPLPLGVRVSGPAVPSPEPGVTVQMNGVVPAGTAPVPGATAVPLGATPGPSNVQP